MNVKDRHFNPLVKPFVEQAIVLADYGRLVSYIQMRFAFVAAMFNILQDLFHFLHPEADLYKMSIPEFSL